jgi:thiol-disulfide isomerase/thioredoxin
LAVTAKLAIGTLLLALLTAPAAAGRGDEAAAVGQTAPRFRLRTLNPDDCGVESFSLKRHAGPKAKEPRRAIVLSFVASWCKPCRAELPDLKTLAARHGDRGVLTAIDITDTEPEGREAMRQLAVDELKLPFPVVADLHGIVTRRYGAEKLPFLVVIDGTGRVVWLQAGGTDALAHLEATLDKLSEPGTDPKETP